MIEYCSKRILTIALLTLVLLASVIFYIEESVNTSLRPPRPSFDVIIPCSTRQSFHFVTSCKPCNSIDRKFDSTCKETGYHVQIVCNEEKRNAKNGNNYADKELSSPLWTACDPDTFRDLSAERRSFVMFEFFIGTCGVIAYVFVRRQHKRLDQRLVDRVNRQILAST